MERAKTKLIYLVPLTLAIIIVLLYLNFQNFAEVFIILGTLPLSLVGSIWLIYWLDFNFSVAVGVGLIALSGVAAEIGVIMLVYLNQSYHRLLSEKEKIKQNLSDVELATAVLRGAGLRVRPVLMTTTATIAGLLPILFGTGTGSEVMQRLAAPMIGGMFSALVLALLVLPVIYFIWRRHAVRLQNYSIN